MTPSPVRFDWPGYSFRLWVPLGFAELPAPMRLAGSMLQDVIEKLQQELLHSRRDAEDLERKIRYKDQVPSISSSAGLLRVAALMTRPPVKTRHARSAHHGMASLFPQIAAAGEAGEGDERPAGQMQDTLERPGLPEE